MAFLAKRRKDETVEAKGQRFGRPVKTLDGPTAQDIRRRAGAGLRWSTQLQGNSWARVEHLSGW